MASGIATVDPAALKDLSKGDIARAYLSVKGKAIAAKTKEKLQDKRTQQMMAGAGGWLIGAGATGAVEGYFKAAAQRDGEDIAEAGKVYGIPYSALAGVVLVAIGGIAGYKKPDPMTTAALEAGKANLALHTGLYAAMKTQEMMFAETMPAEHDAWIG